MPARREIALVGAGNSAGQDAGFDLALDLQLCLDDAGAEAPWEHGLVEVFHDVTTITTAARISSVQGDHYAGTWPREAFARHGIQYFPSPKARSELYLAFLPLLVSERADLLDNPKMLLQFQTLIRETGKSGKDVVNHAIGAHDDSCNSAAGSLVLASASPPEMKFSAPFVAERPRGWTMPGDGLPPVITDPGTFENPTCPSRPEYS